MAHMLVNHYPATDGIMTDIVEGSDAADVTASLFENFARLISLSDASALPEGPQPVRFNGGGPRPVETAAFPASGFHHEMGNRTCIQHDTSQNQRMAGGTGKQVASAPRTAAPPRCVCPRASGPAWSLVLRR